MTGGAGYIGSHTVLALLDQGWSVIVLDDLSTGIHHAVARSATFYEGDVGDARLLARIIADHGIGSIVHFAGSIVVPESVERPLDYYENNTCKSRNLIEGAVRQDVRHILFSSTAAVYGVPARIPIREDDPKAPINPYGASKLMTETMLAHGAAAHGFNYGALRYFNVAGADPDGRAGQSTPGATHLIKVAAECAVGKRTSVQVLGTDFETPDGTGVRDYIHVSDLARAHVLALQRLHEKPSQSFAYNCGYGHGYSVLEVLDAVDRVLGHRQARTVGTRRAGDPASLVADSSAIRTQLGWQPLYDDLDTIVAHAVAWERILQERLSC